MLRAADDDGNFPDDFMEAPIQPNVCVVENDQDWALATLLDIPMSDPTKPLTADFPCFETVVLALAIHNESAVTDNVHSNDNRELSAIFDERGDDKLSGD